MRVDPASRKIDSSNGDEKSATDANRLLAAPAEAVFISGFEVPAEFAFCRRPKHEIEHRFGGGRVGDDAAFAYMDPFRTSADHKLNLARERPGLLKEQVGTHSVAFEANRGVMPASSSSQPSMGVTSTAIVGPKLQTASVMLRLAAAPISRMTLSSAAIFSADCAEADRAQAAPIHRASKPMKTKLRIRSTD